MAETEKAEIIPDEPITYTAQIPSTKLEVEGDWPKGTILNINLSLRVRGRVDGEDRKGNETLHHLLAVEEAAILSVTTPAQRKAAYEAALAAEQKVIDEEPGQEDQIEHPGIEVGEGIEHPADGTWSPEVSNEPQELVNELAPETAEGEDWSDVEAKDAEKRQLQVESVEQVAETDAHQFEEVNF